jgi:two-component system LytT family sensor kinase
MDYRMKRGWQIFCHVFFWVSMIAFFGFVTHNNTKISIEGLLVIFVLYGAINLSLFYINFLLLIPRFLNRKKYLWYNINLLILIIGYGFIKYGVAVCFKQYILIRGSMHEVVGFASYYISAFFTSLIFVFLSTVLKFTLDWFLNERIQRDLENQRLSAELAFLKSQINPHFLFNSLNSIYSLAYQRSETTPEAILKLSEIMRYMLYECNDNKVDLGKELQYLQNYIDLQKIRYGNKAFVDFEVNGLISNQRIVPLLLISFIENAFKHGVANDPLTPIHILMDVEPEHLSFKMENKKHQFNKDSQGGIGLNNVKRRLDLLYPGKYQMKIDDNADTYSTELSLDL